MSIKRKIEENVTVWFLGTLVAAFIAGFGAYRAILEVSIPEVVSQDKLNRLEREVSQLESTLTDMSRAYDSLLLLQNQRNSGSKTPRDPQPNTNTKSIRGKSIAIGYLISRGEDALKIKDVLAGLGAEATLRAYARPPTQNVGCLYYRDESILKTALAIKEKIKSIEKVDVIPVPANNKYKYWSVQSAKGQVSKDERNGIYISFLMDINIWLFQRTKH